MPAMVTILDNRQRRHPEKAGKPDTPVLRKPDWIRVRVPAASGQFGETRRVLREHGLVTVCEEAACPNIGECWSQRHATMMIMGDTCTRACAFCNVATGLPKPLDAAEPENVASAIAKLALEPRGDHLGRPRRSGRRRRGAFRADHPRHPGAHAGDHHRGADARLPAQGGRGRDRGGRQAPTSTTTTWRRCRGCISRSARARATSPRSDCCRR